MRFLVLASGGYGDVLPFIALAERLDRSGHEVTLFVPPKFKSYAQEYEISCCPIDFDLDEEVRHQAKLFESDPCGLSQGVKRRLLQIQSMAKTLAKYHDSVSDLYRGRLNSGIDVVIYHYPLMCGDEIAERLGSVGVPVCLQPFWVSTSSFVSASFPFHLPRALNRASYLYGEIYWILLHAYASRWRTRRLGTRRQRGFRRLLRSSGQRSAAILQAFSSHVLPAPASYPFGVHTTGFWFLPPSRSWKPPDSLLRFLESGPEPIFVGFGTWGDVSPPQAAKIFVEAARIAGVRILLVGGGSVGRTDAQSDVYHLNEAPFDWLFPRMAAVVHHGGIGTSSRALAAGKPQVICPFGLEHDFFAQRMVSLGVAVPPLPQSRLTAEDLAVAIREAVTNEEIASYAKKVREEVSALDGTDEARKILESLREE